MIRGIMEFKANSSYAGSICMLLPLKFHIILILLTIV